MTAGIYDITIEQGATWTTTLAVTDSNGSIVDLTGYTAEMQVREYYDRPLLLSLLVGSGITITGSDGVIVLEVSASDTANLSFDSAVYDLELTYGTTKSRLLRGNVVLSKEVTK